MGAVWVYLIIGGLLYWYHWTALPFDPGLPEFWGHLIGWPIYLLGEWQTRFPSAPVVGGFQGNWLIYLAVGALAIFIAVRAMRLFVYMAIGAGLHVLFWGLPFNLRSGRFWLDTTLWPFVMLWDWPKAADHLPKDALEGIGYLIGLIFIVFLVGAIGRGMVRRSRGGW